MPKSTSTQFPISCERIAELLECPAENVKLYWPLIEQCLRALGIGGELTCVAALATVRVECPPFKPIKEYGGEAYLNKMYDTRAGMGNTPAKDGDGAKFAGRGFIQITGKANYLWYGKQMGADLVAHPELALEPNTAAVILAAYFHEKVIDHVAGKRDWQRVRKLVNGGYNGLSEFLKYVGILEDELLAMKAYEGNT